MELCFMRTFSIKSKTIDATVKLMREALVRGGGSISSSKEDNKVDSEIEPGYSNLIDGLRV